MTKLCKSVVTVLGVLLVGWTGATVSDDDGWTMDAYGHVSKPDDGFKAMKASATMDVTMPYAAFEDANIMWTMDAYGHVSNPGDGFKAMKASVPMDATIEDIDSAVNGNWFEYFLLAALCVGMTGLARHQTTLVSNMWLVILLWGGHARVTAAMESIHIMNDPMDASILWQEVGAETLQFYWNLASDFCPLSDTCLKVTGSSSIDNIGIGKGNLERDISFTYDPTVTGDVELEFSLAIVSFEPGDSFSYGYKCFDSDEISFMSGCALTDGFAMNDAYSSNQSPTTITDPLTCCDWTRTDLNPTRHVTIRFSFDNLREFDRVYLEDVQLFFSSVYFQDDFAAMKEYNSDNEYIIYTSFVLNFQLNTDSDPHYFVATTANYASVMRKYYLNQFDDTVPSGATKLTFAFDFQPALGSDLELEVELYFDEHYGLDNVATRTISFAEFSDLSPQHITLDFNLRYGGTPSLIILELRERNPVIGATKFYGPTFTFSYN